MAFGSFPLRHQIVIPDRDLQWVSPHCSKVLCQVTVNRLVVGSNPTRGANFRVSDPETWVTERVYDIGDNLGLNGCRWVVRLAPNRLYLSHGFRHRWHLTSGMGNACAAIAAPNCQQTLPWMTNLATVSVASGFYTRVPGTRFAATWTPEQGIGRS
jgi:hypothetical protein